MPRFVVMRALIGATVALMVGAVWLTASLARSTDNTTEHELVANRELIVAMLDQETGLRGYANTGLAVFLQPYKKGRQDLERALAAAHGATKDKTDRGLVAEEERVARAWQLRAERRVDDIRRGERSRDVAVALKRKALMDRFRRANGQAIAYLRARRVREKNHADRITTALVSGLGLLFVLLGWGLVERPARRDARSRRALAEFGDAMQVARSEEEAYSVLRGHLEHLLTRARAAVFTRNASANRLQAATAITAEAPLAGRLDDAAPESGLAVRLAKPHLRNPGKYSLMACEICGALPGHSACVPSIVGGEVVGSVLVETPNSLTRRDLDDTAAAVSGAGPVIANLRNLSIAELRAATDVLTGLPNRRAIKEALNRMALQATRNKLPLAAVALDLDHFKEVNDVYGHPKGEEVLTLVEETFRECLRGSDLAGRIGGEEFLVLLPDTDGPGAITLGEKIRTAIETADVPGLPDGVTASLGIAVLPTHAQDGDGLMRAADRAL